MNEYIYDMKIPYFVLVSLQIKLENKTYCLSFCEWISNQNQHCFLYIYDIKILYFVLVSLQIKLENLFAKNLCPQPYAFPKR